MHPLSSPSYEMGSDADYIQALLDYVYCHHQDSASGDNGDCLHNSSVSVDYCSASVFIQGMQPWLCHKFPADHIPFCSFSCSSAMCC